MSRACPQLLASVVAVLAAHAAAFDPDLKDPWATRRGITSSPGTGLLDPFVGRGEPGAREHMLADPWTGSSMSPPDPGPGLGLLDPFRDAASTATTDPELIDPFRDPAARPTPDPDLLDPFADARAGAPADPDLLDPFAGTRATPGSGLLDPFAPRRTAAPELRDPFARRAAS